ncbi:thrombospondin type-1 domain-containing protein [Sphingomonas sp. 3-13AW]|uniref:thrombospondin type-1 domain-containing protein n=1 Tax=Sphingomonas sp. 3-13AW TaxID=3050450 RepID=UPI003BB71DE8
MRRSLDPKTRTFTWLPEDWSQCSNSCGAGQQTRQVQCTLNGKRGAPEVNCTSEKPETIQACYDVQGCSFTWSAGEWSDVAGCGDVVQTRSLSCVRGDGQVVSNSECPTPTPPTAQSVRDLRTCSYDWKSSQWSTWSDECQTGATSTRSVWCERSNGEKVSDAECASSGAKPQGSQSEDRYGQCSYTWVEKPWGAWSSTCETDATRSREVTCVRSNGDEVAHLFCEASSAMPRTTEQSDQYGSCSYSWKAEEWGAVAPACGVSVKSRAVQCIRSNGDVVADGSCNAADRPADQEKVNDYSTCTYGWKEGSWGAPSNSCGDAISSRSVTCVSSDGRNVADAFCTAAKPTSSKSSYETSGCSYTWNASDPWGAPVAACGATVQNRSVTCTRSDGQTVADTLCNLGSRPASQQAAIDYSTCTYAWKEGAWSAPSNMCGDATSTRSVTCVSSDGRTVADASCAGQKPAGSKSTYETSGCSYSWNPSPSWGAPVPACGATVQSRSISCLRSDGQTASDALCPSGTKPPATQAATDYSLCTYAWREGAWSAPSKSCGDATSTRSVTCASSDGRTVADTSCTGQKPAGSKTSYETSGCSFSWNAAAPWGAPVPACGATVQNRPVTCLRSDGQTVADGSCSAATKPATQQSATDYSTCTYGWTATAWSNWSSSCGQATQTRTATCQSSDGRSVADSFCGATAKPVVSQSAYQTSGCSYAWQAGAFGAPAAACGATTQTRTVSCLRSDGQSVADNLCAAGSKPPASQAATDYSRCTYDWVASGWGAWSSSCGQASQSRTATCRSSDGRTVADSFCSAGTKPALTQSAYQTSGCSYAWQAGAFGAPTAACGASTQTRSVSCRRSDLQTVADALCPAASKPPVTQATTDYSTCTYAWVASGWGNWSSTCGNATQTRTATCRSSDGRTVAESFCSASAKPTLSQSAYQTSGCTYAWQAGAFGAPAAACGATTQTRAVTCLRSDAQTVGDTFCPAASKPSTTQAATDYSRCTYAWVASAWGAWSSTCGQASQSRTATCRSSDGRTVADTFCTASTKPALTQSAYQTSGCSYVWQAGTFGAPVAACGATSQSRTVACVRSDGQGVADSLCPAASRPSATQAATDYSKCTYTWDATAWGAWSTSCGQGTQTRTVSCKRSDGTKVADTSCAGTEPVSSQSAYQVSGCSFSWKSSAWGAAAAACGASTQTRSVWCERSDGTSVADSQCGSGKPAVTQAATNYSACSFKWAYSGWTTTSQTCGTTVQSRTVWCQRSDGTTVADSNCGSGKPGATQSLADYSTCTYSAVNPGNWSAWSSTCSASAARSRTYQCRRADGAIVANAECTNRGISLSEGQTSAVYDGCSYSVSGWSAWSYNSTCSTSATATQTATGCRRSDGTAVPVAECSSRGTKTTQTTTTSNLTGCGYSWQADGWSAQQNVCTSGTQTRAVWCKRSDGTRVDDGPCGAGRPAGSQSYSNTLACGYTASYGAWGACQSNNQRTQSMTACIRSDGAPVAAAECVNRNQAATKTEACTTGYAPGVQVTSRPLYYTCAYGPPSYFGCTYIAGYGYMTEASCTGTQAAAQCLSGSARFTPINRGTLNGQCSLQCQ